MAWSKAPTSDRKARLPKDWQARRAQVLRRAGYRCEAKHSDGSRCEERATDVDHIVAGDDHSLTNLQALCSWHHDRKTAREAAEARRRRPRPSRRRPPEAHPGLL